MENKIDRRSYQNLEKRPARLRCEAQSPYLMSNSTLARRKCRVRLQFRLERWCVHHFRAAEARRFIIGLYKCRLRYTLWAKIEFYAVQARDGGLAHAGVLRACMKVAQRVCRGS